MRTDRDACGLNSLILAVAFLSDQPSQPKIYDLLPIERAPFSLSDLDRTAKQLGYETCMVHWDSTAQARFTCPAILYVRSKSTSPIPDHFIACFGDLGDRICVADFPHRPLLLSKKDLSERWNGDVLYIDKKGGKNLIYIRYSLFRGRWLAYIGLGVALILVAKIILERRRSTHENKTI